MSRALITGGAGSIGLHLTRRLRREGWEVTLLDNLAQGRRDADLERNLCEGGVELLVADLGSTPCAAVTRTDFTHVFHLAAQLGVQNVVEHPRMVLEANVDLTVNALAIARRQRALQRFVFASTSEVYAGTLEHFDLPVPTPESTPLALPPLERPRTSYMLSKLYGEALCLHSGLPVTIVRPHNVYGPRMGRAHVVPNLLERAHGLAPGEALEVFSTEHTRTFCFVEDAVEMIFRLSLEPAAIGQVVNVGTERPEIRIGDLARIVLEVVGRRAALRPGPTTAGSPPRRAPDMARCTRITGYASQVALEDGIARSYSWYRPRFEEEQA